MDGTGEVHVEVDDTVVYVACTSFEVCYDTVGARLYPRRLLLNMEEGTMF